MSFSEWPSAKKNIESNNRSRINWKEYFGESISSAINSRLRLGYDIERTRKVLLKRLEGTVNDEVIRRFHVSFASRICEYEKNNRSI